MSGDLPAWKTRIFSDIYAILTYMCLNIVNFC